MASGRIRIGYPNPGVYTLAADFRTFALSGQAAGLVYGQSDPGGSGFTPSGSFNASGTPAIDGAFTITGPSGSFGSGPTVSLYNDFRNTAPGVLVANNAAVIGSYNGNSEGSDLIGSSVPYIGTRSANVRNEAFTSGASAAIVRNKVVDVGVCNEVYLMFAIKPNNRYMSGVQNSFNDGSTFGSNWKWFWAHNGSITGSTYDVVNVSVTGGTQFAGNSVSPDSPYQGPDLGHFDYADWNLMEFWVKHGANPKVDAGIGGGWVTNSNGRFGSQGAMVFASGFGGTVQITHVIMPPAYFGNLQAYTGLRPDLGLQYLASGPNSAARIVIGNASTFAACTRFYPFTPTAWSDTSITATLRGNTLAGLYLYVVKSDNTTVRSIGTFV